MRPVLNSGRSGGRALGGCRGASADFWRVPRGLAGGALFRSGRALGSSFTCFGAAEVCTVRGKDMDKGRNDEMAALEADEDDSEMSTEAIRSRRVFYLNFIYTACLRPRQRKRRDKGSMASQHVAATVTS